MPRPGIHYRHVNTSVHLREQPDQPVNRESCYSPTPEIAQARGIDFEDACGDEEIQLFHGVQNSVRELSLQGRYGIVRHSEP
jgi:hypothetical protein